MAESGIYEIVNLVNGKRYVGSSCNLRKRQIHHWGRLRAGKHANRYLQAAWAKYGDAAFAFQILEHCPQSVLIEREQANIDELKPEYNLSPTAGSCGGVRQPPRDVDARKRIAEAARLAWDVRRREGRTSRGEFTEDHVRRLSESQKVVWAERKSGGWEAPAKSPEHRQALSESRRRLFASGYKMPPRTADHAEALRQATIRAWADPEIKEKRRSAIKADWARRKSEGYCHPPLTEHQRKKQSEGVKASYTPELRQLRSEQSKAMWAKRRAANS